MLIKDNVVDQCLVFPFRNPAHKGKFGFSLFNAEKSILFLTPLMAKMNILNINIFELSVMYSC